MVGYLEIILFPYIDKKRQELHVPPTYPSLVIFDQLKKRVQRTLLKCLKHTISLLLLFLQTALIDSTQVC